MRLHPFSSFVVLPIFALANAGVSLQRDMLATDDARSVAMGVALGLVMGKVVGILAGSWIALRLRIAVLPAGVRWPHLIGIAVLGGIGFTVSLFISALAFDDAQLVDAAKLAVLCSSIVSAVAGMLVLWRADPQRRTES